MHGTFSNRYKFRTTGGTHDNDLDSTLSLDVGDPWNDRISGSLMGGGIFDFDGAQAGSPFSSVYDSWSQTAVPRLYYGYVDVRDLGPLHNIRAGRQQRFEFESLYFDGALLESATWNGLSAQAFGGIPVHLFENQSGLDPGDWMAGGALQWDPLSNLRARLDYAHVRDKVTGFRSTFGDLEDDLAGLSTWWEVTPNLTLTSRLTSFSDQLRDGAASATLSLPENDFTLRVSFFRLLQGYDIRVIEWDAFGIAGTYRKYSEGSLHASKGFGDHLSVAGGGAYRKLDDEQIASAFNHGFERGYLSLSAYEWPLEGFSVTASGDYYRGEDNVLKNDSVASSLTAEQLFLGKQLAVEAGSGYYLYRFNLFSGNESQDVRTYFGRFRYKFMKAFEARAGYEFERNAVNDFHYVDGRILWKF